MSQDASMEELEGDCWICLSAAADRLVRPCACPKLVHAKCLARWQLQKAGTAEERRCRFCDAALPDWRENLGAGEGDVRPTVSLEYKGEVKHLRLSRAEGQLDLTRLVKDAFGIPDDLELDFSFECKVPGSDVDLKLRGAAALPAALHCAAATARRRECDSAAPKKRRQV